MLYKMLRGIGFAKFILCRVRPRRKAVSIIIKKMIQKSLGFHQEKYEIIFQSSSPLKLVIGDSEQLSHLFNIFYSEPFRITSELPKNPIIIDGGANIGMASVYYYSKYPTAKIYAIEPYSENIKILKNNLSGIPAAEIYEYALWDESKNISINIEKCSRYNSILGHNGSKTEEKVRAICLEEFLNNNRIPMIDVLKLNVEGAESKALEGLGKRIADVRIISGEFHPQYLNMDAFKNQLKSNGFELMRMEKMGKITWAFEACNQNLPSQ
jgi:FkbM family methyltransferase